MSDAEIKTLEGKPEVEEGNRLVYSDDVGGVETQVVYRFNHRNELYAIEYHFHLEKPLMTTALSQFDKISEILHTNYGPPDEGSRHADREKRLGLLAMEKPIEENWSRDSTTYVSHRLTPGKSYRHVLIYGHRALTDEYDAFLKQKAKEKL